KTTSHRAFIGLHCADCGAGTITLGEYYMVKDHVWAYAWAGQRRPWQLDILCIGCLEKRIGRTLMRCDFANAPVNNPTQDDISDRLRARLTAEGCTVAGFLAAKDASRSA